VKKFWVILIAVTVSLSLSGCGILMMRENWEKTTYEDAITDLFSALDRGDRHGVKALFSAYVREQDADLDDDIEKLFSVYQGPVDEVGWDGLLAGSYSSHFGQRESSVYAHFPVRCADTYYWCDLEIMYENSLNPLQIGVTQLSFYTADEWCINAYDDDAIWCDEAGLSVFADRTVDEEIRCIDGNPYKYRRSEKPLDLQEVRNFFKKPKLFPAFAAQFGEPNAEDFFAIYELQPENGEARYLEISYDELGRIYSACIVDQFGYLETIYEWG
jgi:hypothetical protein